MKITLCVITFNEEQNLRRCLESVQGIVDEIVVVDSGSTDGTREVAASFGARFEPQAWLGYGPQKNKAMSLAKSDWVLSLDADEALSAPLREEILQLATDEPTEIGGFSMPRCVFFEGKWIRHGDWYPDRLVRLFRKNEARFVGGKVHERLEISGAVRELAGEIEHYSFRDAADHLARGERYARLWAETQLENGKRARPWDPIARSIYKLLRGFVLRRGFLDGSTGWGIAWRNACEVYRKYVLLKQLQSSVRLR